MIPQSPRKINLRPLKQLALERLPRNWVLREILLTEKDEIEAVEYVAKVDVWFRLLKIDSSKNRAASK